MSTRRIILNITTSYLQTGLSIILGLFSSRWIYLALGEVKFGLFALVGALISGILFISPLLTVSFARFFSISIGAGNNLNSSRSDSSLNDWFNTAFCTALILSGLFLVAGYPLGIYLINTKLNIPAAYNSNLVAVFKISAITACLVTLHIPFSAMYTAKQLIFVKNFLGIAQTVLTAGAAAWLMNYSGDRLVLHALLSGGILVVVNISMVVFALLTMPDVKIRPATWIVRSRFVNLFNYILFSLIGSVASLLSGPGVSSVINVFLGPVANASHSIATTVNSKTMVLSSTLTSSIFPEIASRLGAGDIESAKNLAVRLCYYSCSALLIVLFPIVFWMDLLLNIWLGHPPPNAASLTRFLLIGFFIPISVCGYYLYVEASGKIRLYQSVFSILRMMPVFILWFLLRLKFSFVIAFGVASILPGIGMVIYILIHTKEFMEFPLSWYIKQVLVPVATTIAVATSICMTSTYLFPKTFFFFIICLAMNAVSTGICSYHFLTISERQKIQHYFFKKPFDFLTKKKAGETDSRKTGEK